MKLRRINIEDLETRVAWMNNPMVYSSMHFDLPVMLDDTIKWYKANRDNNTRVDVCFEDDHTILAFGGITSIDPCLKKGELYVFVSPNLQKRGIGTRAVRLLCSFGFEQLGLHKIYLLANEDNNPAISVYRKCGFKQEGRHRDEYMDDGKYKDRLYFGLLNYEFVNEELGIIGDSCH